MKLLPPTARLCLSTLAVAAPFAATFAAPMAAPEAAPPIAASRGSVIYSNFNSDPAHLYDCCSGRWQLRGVDVGFPRSYAQQFVPAVDARLRKVTVALSYISGSNSVLGSLRADRGGFPGKVIAEFAFENLPASGTCCQTEFAPGRHVPLKAGATYWIVAMPSNLGILTWNLDNTGQTGIMAFNAGEGTFWQNFADVQGAMELIGD